jgi:hypothetical protein
MSAIQSMSATSNISGGATAKTSNPVISWQIGPPLSACGLWQVTSNQPWIAKRQRGEAFI